MDKIALGAAEYTADQIARSIELSGQLIKRLPPEQRKREQKIIDKMKAILAKKRAEESAAQEARPKAGTENGSSQEGI